MNRVCLCGILSIWICFSQVQAQEVGIAVDTMPAYQAMQRVEPLWEEGKKREALAQIEQAVAIYAAAKEWEAYLEAAKQYAMGSVYSREYEMGLRFCQQIDTVFLRKQGITGDPLSNYLLTYAYLLEGTGDFQASDRVYAQTLIGYREEGITDSLLYWERIANLHQVRGVNALNVRGDWKQAISCVRVNYRIRKKHFPQSRELADALSDLAHLYDYAGRNDSTIWAYQQAVEMYEEQEPPPFMDLGLVLHNLSYAYGRIGNLQAELESAKEALAAWQAVDSSTSFLQDREKYIRAQADYLPKAYQHLASISRSLGDEETDLDFSQKSLELVLAYAEPQSEVIGIAYLKMGQSYGSSASPEKGLPYLDLAEKEFAQMGKAGSYYQAVQFSARAALYREMGEYEEAIRFFEKSSGGYEGEQLAVNAAGCFINLSSVYRQMEDWPQVQSHLLQAQEVLGGDLQGYGAMIHTALGVNFAREGKAEASICSHQRSLALLSGRPDLEGGNPGKNPQADDFFHNDESLSFLISKANSLLRLSMSTDSALLFPAWETYSLALEILNSLQQRAQSTREILTEEGLQLFEGAIQCAYLLGEKTHDAQYHAALFQLMEQNKSASLRKNFQRSRASLEGGLPLNLRQQERELSANIAFFEENWQSNRLLPTAEQDSIKGAYWKERLLELRQQKRQLLEKFSKEYPAYYQTRYESGGLSLEELQAQLQQRGEWMIEYFVGDSTLLIFALNGKRSQVHHSLITPAWQAELRTFLQSLAHPGNLKPSDQGTDFIQQSELWYQRLIAPIASLANVPGQTLVIVPDGTLGWLPFEVLLTEPGSAWTGSYASLPYLFRRYPLRYAFSAAWQHWTPSQATSPSQELLAMAPAYSGRQNPLLSSRGMPLHKRGPFRALNHNQSEISEISAHWEGESQTLIGGTASEAAFKQLAVQQQVLHLAMHAYLDEDDPMFSALVFAEADSLHQSAAKNDFQAEDGYLHAFEIYNLRLKAQLVVLSACQTGTGKVQAGEGVMSLAQAFAYAGAKNLISSLWQVDDAATGELMQRFYEHLSEGKSQAEAHREARLDYLEKYPQAHPSYWSAWVLWGEGEALQQKDTGILSVWGIGFLLLIGGILLFLWDRKGRKVRHFV